MLRLDLDDGRLLDFDANEALMRVTNVDFGFPEVREVTGPRPDQPGTMDRTTLFGSRAVSIEGYFVVDHQLGRRMLAPFLVPGARPWLTYRDTSSRSWPVRVRLRADQFSAAVEAGPQKFTASWIAPDGVLEHPTEHLLTLIPYGEAPGRSYPLTYPRIYPAGGGATLIARNDGSADAGWVARIWGPCTGARLVRSDTGDTVALAATYEIAAGTSIEIDSVEHTILADGDPDATRYGALDPVTTRWWQVPGGGCPVRFTSESHAVPASVEFRWRDTYLI